MTRLGPPTPIRGKKDTCPKGYRTKLKLFGQNWSIKYVRRILEKDGTELFGYSDAGKREIGISSALCSGAMRDTLLHEIIHSYYRMSPCMSDEPTLPEDPDHAEEALVVLHTTIFLDLLANNKWVKDLLTKE